MSKSRLWILGGLIMMAIAAATDASYLMAKATLAQHLIARAWDKSLNNDGEPHKPWPWADTVVVARLSVAAADLDTWVLDGSNGTSLAFGPGMVSGSAAPGETGLTVIGAHRDTHFNNLEAIAVDDIIRLQDTGKRWHEYRVSHIDIADSRTDKIVADHTESRLLLITCYPFNAILPDGPLRYVVEAHKISS